MRTTNSLSVSLLIVATTAQFNNGSSFFDTVSFPSFGGGQKDSLSGTLMSNVFAGPVNGASPWFGS